jgi:hypothetical protein
LKVKRWCSLATAVELLEQRVPAGDDEFFVQGFTITIRAKSRDAQRQIASALAYQFMGAEGQPGEHGIPYSLEYEPIPDGCLALSYDMEAPSLVAPNPRLCSVTVPSPVAYNERLASEAGRGASIYWHRSRILWERPYPLKPVEFHNVRLSLADIDRLCIAIERSRPAEGKNPAGTHRGGRPPEVKEAVRVWYAGLPETDKRFSATKLSQIYKHTPGNPGEEGSVAKIIGELRREEAG